MALNVNFRVYNFSSKCVENSSSVTFQENDVDGDCLYKKIAEVLQVESDKLRDELGDIQPAQCVASFYQMVAHLLSSFNRQLHSYHVFADLVFCGKIINPCSKLSTSGFRSGNSIQVLFKTTTHEIKPQPVVDRMELLQVMAVLNKVLIGRQNQFTKYKKNLIKLLTEPEKMQPIIDQVPGLKNQRLILDILTHPELLGHALDPKNCDRIMEEYKALGAAVVLIAKITNIKSLRNQGNIQMMQHPGPSFLSREEYEDEDMEIDPRTPTSSRRVRGTSQRSAGSLITSNQLAQALSLANSPVPGRIFPSPMGSSASSNIQSPQTDTSSSGATNMAGGGGGNIISPDVFSMAMQQALASQGIPPNPSGRQQDSNPPERQLDPEVMARGLEQLRGMGISDEVASRHALIASGGNVETAVNILFSSGLNDL